MWVTWSPLRFPGPLCTSASGLVHTCVVMEHRSISYVVWLNDYNSLSLNLELSIWVRLSNLGDAGHLLCLRCRHRLLCSALHWGLGLLQQALSQLCQSPALTTTFPLDILQGWQEYIWTSEERGREKVCRLA